MISGITVAYFHGSPLPNLKFKHNEEFVYSKKKRNYIVDKVLEAGYNVMLQQRNKETVDLIIWIDKYRFQQR